MLRVTATAAGAALSIASLLLSVGVVPGGATVSHRMALAAALCGVPLLLGGVRRALERRRPNGTLAAGAAVVVVIAAGFTLVAAFVITVFLAVHVVATGAHRAVRRG